MNAREIILSAFARARNERGLKIAEPSGYLSKGHIKKADHDLVVMTDMDKLMHEDWVVTAAYYAMYHAAMAVLSKIGLESKEHAATAAVLEYFFGAKIGKPLIESFNDIKERKDKLHLPKIEEKYMNNFWDVKRSRETMQYGIALTFSETEKVMAKARDFVMAIKLLVEDIDGKAIDVIREETRKQQSEAARRINEKALS